MKKEIPIWEKYTLNVEEAAIYYGIGIKRLYEIIRSNPNADFLLEIGSHYRIKRNLFEKFLDKVNTVQLTLFYGKEDYLMVKCIYPR